MSLTLRMPRPMREVDMGAGFEASGGALEAEELVCRLRDATSQPISCLARWIVSRQVLSMTCHSRTLLPMFQFRWPGPTIKTGVGEVIAELSGVFDDAEIADWFVRPNGWLAQRLPAQVLDTEPEAVLQAARADRFVARG